MLKNEKVYPCKTCLVVPCCSTPCIDYAEYVYETKAYGAAGGNVKQHIEEMTYEEAIDHILMVESIFFYVREKS